MCSISLQLKFSNDSVVKPLNKYAPLHAIPPITKFNESEQTVIAVVIICWGEDHAHTIGMSLTLLAAAVDTFSGLMWSLRKPPMIPSIHTGVIGRTVSSVYRKLQL